MQKITNTRKIAIMGMLTAVAYVLMLIDFNVPLMPDFIKFDFSDLPELIASYYIGPMGGFMVCLSKNILHLFFTKSVGIGELSNFLIGCAFVLPAGFIYRHKKDFRGAIIASFVGTLSMGLMCILSNYFIIYPLYVSVLNFSMESILSMYQVVLPSVNSLFTALIVFNLPFTIFKGLIISIIILAIYKRLKFIQ